VLSTSRAQLSAARYSFRETAIFGLIGLENQYRRQSQATCMGSAHAQAHRKKGRNIMYAELSLMAGKTFNVPSFGPVCESEVQPCSARNTPPVGKPRIVMSGRPWRCACCWAVLTCARSIIEVRIRLGPRSYSIAPQGNVSPLNISLSAVLYPTDIPWIVLPPPTFQNSLVRLPIKRIFPPFHAPSIAMRTECKSTITRPTDPQPIRIAKRLVERDRAGVCGLLVP
jgi:hypothetical protein